jgi:hypothetical protein
MTSEYTAGRAGQGAPYPGAESLPQETEVERARAELVAALTELEDKVNIPKKIRRLREEEPGKFTAALSAVGAVAAGILALGVVVVARRK